MKRYCARIGLLIGSMMMALAGNLIALGAAIVGSNRAWPVAVANDQALNAALVGRTGSEDETVSSRAGKAARKGRSGAVCSAACWTRSTLAIARRTSSTTKWSGRLSEAHLALMTKLEELDAYTHTVLHQFPKLERHLLCAEMRTAMNKIMRLTVVAWKRRALRGQPNE